MKIEREVQSEGARERGLRKKPRMKMEQWIYKKN